ncbi:MAG: hypothetical protein II493_01120 [Spirochaetales bacterium]|nr:hypothetical protein [Spirochaetales bacterium]
MEAARKIGFFGNCCVRNVRYEAESRRFKVNDNLGFDEIASRAGLRVTDFSKFGCTVTKAESYIEKMFPVIYGDLVFMDFGRYDSDCDWKTISEFPLERHGEVTPLNQFTDAYDRIIDHVLKLRKMPVLATLVPVDARAHIDHVCRTENLNRDNVLRWLAGGYNKIEESGKIYSDAVKELAFRREVPLIDIRQAFEEQGKKGNLLREDGFTVSDAGRRVIRDCFERFVFDYLTF